MDLKKLSTKALQRQLKAAQQAAGRQGRLDWKLRPCQRPLYEAYKGATSRKVAWKVSRRFGKSFVLCLIATELCIQKEGIIVHYAAPTAKMVKNILVPIMRQIFRDAPKDLRPRWKKMEGLWEFPNGSVIHMAGVDNQGADNLRGMASWAFILDEAGFMDSLEYMISDIALPQTLTTDGRILIASTPSRYPGHYFSELCKEAEGTGNFVHRTIYDSSTITEKLLEEYMRESGGENSATWKREYLAEETIDETNAIIPEYQEAAPFIELRWEVPKHRDTYTVMDLGWSPDFSFVVFAYRDFLSAKTVIEGEFVCWKMVTDDLAEGIIQGEHKYFGLHGHLYRDGKLMGREERMKAAKANPKAPRPYGRYSDIDKQIMHDLNVLHGVMFSAVQKPPGEKEAGINALRLAIKQHELIIHPRCKELRKHLKNGTWNDLHTDFKRIPGYGHFDGIDAARYLVRHVDKHHNPYPAGEGVSEETHRIRRRSGNQRGLQKMVNAFKPFGATPRGLA